MQCPECKTNSTHVIRTESYDTVIIRRRRCKNCGCKFPTYETLCYEAFAKSGQSL